MKRTYKEFWVEFDFSESRFGNRPGQIRSFKNKEDAEAFAKTIEDARIVEIVFTETV